MVVHYKQIQRKRNRERETERYKRKREKRAYLTEAFNDGELDLYKPEHTESRLGKHHPLWVKPSTITPTEEIIKGYADNRAESIMTSREISVLGSFFKPVKFNWIEKFLLWIKKW